MAKEIKLKLLTQVTNESVFEVFAVVFFFKILRDKAVFECLKVA